MNSRMFYEVAYGLGNPKPGVIRMIEPSPEPLTIMVPNTRRHRVVRHYKGRRYVIRYSMLDVLKGFRP